MTPSKPAAVEATAFEVLAAGARAEVVSAELFVEPLTAMDDAGADCNP